MHLVSMSLVVSLFHLSLCPPHTSSFFFFNDTATTEIYTLSLHDALPISSAAHPVWRGVPNAWDHPAKADSASAAPFLTQRQRSEEHTSELQSRLHLVCRLLLEKKKLLLFVLWVTNIQPPSVPRWLL